jgi:sterol desaturase/sphingolipid hydroxylase (fatty acid hydroxylase superfamily)
MSARFVSNRNESVRMFESDFLEAFSHIHPATPHLIFLPVVAYLLHSALLGRHLPPARALGLACVGLFLWTLTEYLMHRFIFHWQPPGAWGRRVHFIAHGVHHDYPSDATRLVMPPGLSVPLALLFYALFRSAFGPGDRAAAFAGFLLGYLAYDTLHYATHHLPMRGPVLGYLKKYHLKHHFQDDRRAYGVSSPVWDHVFRTAPRP